MGNINIEQTLQNAIEHHKAGRLEQAKSGYHDIILSGSQNPHARHNLALIKISENKNEEALELLRNAKDLDSSVEQFWLTELNLLFKLNKWEELVSAFLKAIQIHLTLNVINCVFEKKALHNIINSADKQVSLTLIRSLRRVVKNHVLTERLQSVSEQLPFAAELISIAQTREITERDILSIKRMLGSKKYSECLKLLENLISNDCAKQNIISESKAECLFNLQRYEEAKKVCFAEINANKSTAQLHNILASVFVGENNYRDAEINWKKALELDPGFFFALSNLGKLYEHKRDLRSASLCYMEALKIDGDHVSTLMSLAILYHKAKNYPKAEELYKKILDIQPDHSRSALSLASLYLETNNFTEAKPLIENAGPKDNTYFGYQISGNYYSKVGDNLSALKFFKKALKLNPQHVEILHSIALSHMKIGERTQAVEACVRALERSNYQYLPSWDLLIICLGGVEDTIAIKYFNRLRKGCDTSSSSDQLLALHDGLADLGLNVPGFEGGVYSFNISKQSNVDHTKVFTLKNFGRSGTGMFHSLIDGHPDIITTPSIFFSEFFHPSNLSFLTANGRYGIVDRLFEKYPAFFDTRRPEPIDTIGHAKIYSIGLQEGLLNLGEGKNEHIEIDRERFRTQFQNLLEKQTSITLGNVFMALCQAYDRVMFSDHRSDKEVIFYHVHNPSRLTEISMIQNLNPKNIVLIREPLQSMESWITKPFEEELADYTAITSRIGGILSHVSTNRYDDAEYFGLRLEDIKEHPSETLKGVCDFFGVDFSETMLNMTSAGKKWWGDPASPNYLEEGSSPFGKKAINRKLGRVFSEQDLFIFDVLLSPFKRQFGYEPFSCEDLSSDHAFSLVSDKTHELFDFELIICEKNSITPQQLKMTGQFQNLRRRIEHRLKQVKSPTSKFPKLLRMF